MDKIGKTEKMFFKGLLVFLLFWYSKVFAYIPIYLFKMDVDNMSTSSYVLLNAFCSLMIAIILFIIYRKDLKQELKIFLSKKMECMNQGFYYYGIGMLVMIASNLIINIGLNGGGANNEEAVQSMIKSLPLVMIFTAGILAPFTEELVFRKALKDFIKSPVIFAFCSFLLFGGAHVFNSAETILDYLYIIPYGALGAAFAFAYSKTDTVFTSMTLHMLHNTLLTIISILL